MTSPTDTTPLAVAIEDMARTIGILDAAKKVLDTDVSECADAVSAKIVISDALVKLACEPAPDAVDWGVEKIAEGVDDAA